METLPGIPPEYAPVVATAISTLSGIFVYAVTALAKKYGRTTGISTVAVTAVLSLTVSLGFNLYQASLVRGDLNLWLTLGMAAWAFLQANGTYIAQVIAAAKGTQVAAPEPAAPATVGELLPPADLIQPTRPLED